MDHSIVHTHALDWHVGALPVLLLAALVLMLYWPSAAALDEVWRSDRGVYSQGYLIGAASLWILALRAREARARLQPTVWAVPALLVLGFAWLIGARSGIQTIEALLLPFIVGVGILAFFGPTVARACVFPCALLLLAIPVWDVLSAPLQTLTTRAAAGLLRAAQVPTVVSGEFIHIRGGTFEIAAACSGLGMLLVGLATAALYGEMQRQPRARRFALLLLAAALSLAANWVRVAAIIAIADRQGMQASIVHDHYGFGWVVFGIMLLAFFPLARRIASAPPQALSVARAGAPMPPAETRLAVTLILAALVLGPAWNWLAVTRVPAAASAYLPVAPAGRWVGPTVPAGAWVPLLPGADAESIGVYAHGPEQVTAFMAAFEVQRHAKKFAGFGVELLGPDQEVLAQRHIEVGGSALEEIEAAAPRGPRTLVWVRYTVDERHFSSAWFAQLGYGLASLSGAPASSIMLFRAECGVDCAAARSSLTRFVTETGALGGA
jgi:exosortase